MDEIEIVKDEKKDLFNVFFAGEKFGVFDKVDDDQYCYFARKEDKLTGNHYIAIGEALNKLNRASLSKKLDRMNFLNHEMQYDLATLRTQIADPEAKALLQAAIDKSFDITKCYEL
jgi:hypothetical protein